MAHWLSADLGMWVLRDSSVAFKGGFLHYDFLGNVKSEVLAGDISISVNVRKSAFEEPEIPDSRPWERTLEKKSLIGSMILKAIDLEEDGKGHERGDGSDWDKLFQFFEWRKRFANSSMNLLLDSLGMQSDQPGGTVPYLVDETFIKNYKKLERVTFRSDLVIPMLNIRLKSEIALIVISFLFLTTIVSMEYHTLEFYESFADREEPWLALDGKFGLPRILSILWCWSPMISSIILTFSTCRFVFARYKIVAPFTEGTWGYPLFLLSIGLGLIALFVSIKISKRLWIVGSRRRSADAANGCQEKK